MEPRRSMRRPWSLRTLSVAICGVSFLVVGCSSGSGSNGAGGRSGSGGDGGRGETGTGGSMGTGGSIGTGGSSGGSTGKDAGGADSVTGQDSATDVGGADFAKADAGTSYTPCPTNGDPCKIMPLGDSITDGYYQGGEGAYRIELFHRALADKKKTITFVGSMSNGPAKVDGTTFPPNHEGHSGYRIKRTASLTRPALLDDVINKTDTLTKNKPHIITLMIGTNDACNSLANMPQNLGKLIDAIYKQLPDVFIVVSKKRSDAGKKIKLV